MKKVNREHIMNTTTPDERSEKEGLAREPRELSSEELESIIGGGEAYYEAADIKIAFALELRDTRRGGE